MIQRTQSLPEQRPAEHGRFLVTILRMPQHRQVMQAQDLYRFEQRKSSQRALDLLLGGIELSGGKQRRKHGRCLRAARAAKAQHQPDRADHEQRQRGIERRAGEWSDQHAQQGPRQQRKPHQRAHGHVAAKAMNGVFGGDHFNFEPSKRRGETCLALFGVDYQRATQVSPLRRRRCGAVSFRQRLHFRITALQLLGRREKRGFLIRILRFI